MENRIYFDGVELIRREPERRFEKFSSHEYDESQEWYCNKCEQYFYIGNRDPICCAYCRSQNIEIM